MKMPDKILDIVTTEEALKLIQFYDTDLYEPYLKRLKEKYRKLFIYLDEE